MLSSDMVPPTSGPASKSVTRARRSVAPSSLVQSTPEAQTTANSF